MKPYQKYNLFLYSIFSFCSLFSQSKDPIGLELLIPAFSIENCEVFPAEDGNRQGFITGDQNLAIREIESGYTKFYSRSDYPFIGNGFLEIFYLSDTNLFLTNTQNNNQNRITYVWNELEDFPIDSLKFYRIQHVDFESTTGNHLVQTQDSVYILDNKLHTICSFKGKYSMFGPGKGEVVYSIDRFWKSKEYLVRDYLSDSIMNQISFSKTDTRLFRLGKEKKMIFKNQNKAYLLLDDYRLKPLESFDFIIEPYKLISTTSGRYTLMISKKCNDIYDHKSDLIFELDSSQMRVFDNINLQNVIPDLYFQLILDEKYVDLSKLINVPFVNKKNFIKKSFPIDKTNYHSVSLFNDSVYLINMDDLHMPLSIKDSYFEPSDYKFNFKSKTYSCTRPHSHWKKVLKFDFENNKIDSILGLPYIGRNRYLKKRGFLYPIDRMEYLKRSQIGLAYGRVDEPTFLIDLDNFEVIRSFEAFNELGRYYENYIIDTDEKIVYLSSSNRRIKIYDSADGIRTANISFREWTPSSFTTSKDTSNFICKFINKPYVYTDSAALCLHTSQKQTWFDSLKGFDFLKYSLGAINAKNICSFHSANSVVVYDLINQKEKLKYQHSFSNQNIIHSEFSQNGKFLYTLSNYDLVLVDTEIDSVKRNIEFTELDPDLRQNERLFAERNYWGNYIPSYPVFSKNSNFLLVRTGQKFIVIDNSNGKKIYSKNINRELFSVHWIENDLLALYSKEKIRIIDPHSGALLLEIHLFENAKYFVLNPNGFYETNLDDLSDFKFVSGSEVYGFDQVVTSSYPNLYQEVVSKEFTIDKNYSQIINRALPPKLEWFDLKKPFQPIVKVGLNEETRGKFEVYIGDSNDLNIPIEQVSKKENELLLKLDLRAYKSSPFIPNGGKTLISLKAHNREESVYSIINYEISGADKIDRKGEPILFKSPEKNLVRAVVNEDWEAFPKFIFIGIGCNYEAAKLANPLSFSSSDIDSTLKYFELSYKNFVIEFVKKVNSEMGIDVSLNSIPFQTLIKKFTLTSTSQPANSLQYVQELFEKAQLEAEWNDFVITMLSGHGIMDKNQEFRFLLDKATNDMVKTDSDVYTITASQIYNWLKLENLKAQKKFLIVDACNGAGAFEGFEGEKNDKSYRKSQIEAFDSFNRKEGIFMIAASGRNENAYEEKALGNGVLTYSILKTLKELSLEGEGLIEIRELIEKSVRNSNKTLKKIASFKDVEISEAKPFYPIISDNNLFIGKLDSNLTRSLVISELEFISIPRVKVYNAEGYQDNKLTMMLNNELEEIADTHQNRFYFDLDLEYQSVDQFSTGKNGIKTLVFKQSNTVSRFSIDYNNDSELQRKLEQKFIELWQRKFARQF